MFTINELYDFAARVRRSFCKKLETLPWEKVTQDREASHHSMRNILLHMIDNEEWIVNWVIVGKASGYKAKKWDEYTDCLMVKAHLDEVESKTRSYLAHADADELGRRVNFVLSSGASFDLSVEESLFQSFTEQLYHMGELIALLWQEDVEPPKMQFFYNNPRVGGS